MGERIFSIWISNVEKRNADPYLTPYIKLNSRLDYRSVLQIYYKYRRGAVKLLKESMGAYLYNLGSSKDFLNRKQKTLTIKGKKTQ